MPDQLGERPLQQVGETAIGRENFTLERKREEQIIEGINQVAVALLRSRDEGEKLSELLVARRRRDLALLDSTHEPAQFGDFARLGPRIDTE